MRQVGVWVGKVFAQVIRASVGQNPGCCIPTPNCVLFSAFPLRRSYCCHQCHPVPNRSHQRPCPPSCLPFPRGLSSCLPVLLRSLPSLPACSLSLVSVTGQLGSGWSSGSALESMQCGHTPSLPGSQQCPEPPQSACSFSPSCLLFAKHEHG